MIRVEQDSMGEIKVSSEAFWGAQTQRSLENFRIGTEKMPLPLIEALIHIKKACALVNLREEKLSVEKSTAIQDACTLLLNDLNGNEAHFPLSLWQTGSGTQTNMNVNEVLAHLASSSQSIHPNDHVNLSQSSNDVFPTAMHMAAFGQIESRLLPELEKWLEILEEMENTYANVIKIGRTHLQDAIPITFGQEVSGWKAMIENSRNAIRSSSKGLLNLAIGGTAVGTGLLAPEQFGRKVAKELKSSLGVPFVSEPNKFFALTSHQPLSFVHGSLRALASDLMKIANDIRWLASGPRNGLGELTLPSNEPGSSIMPGKVNPTQAEALTMIVAQVMGNDTTIQFSASQGNFELNVYKPVIIYNFIQSANLLADGMESFRKNCLKGLIVNEEKMLTYAKNSLMLVTLLAPYIGYDKATKVAQKAYSEKLSLKESAILLGYATQEELEIWLDFKNMIHN